MNRLASRSTGRRGCASLRLLGASALALAMAPFLTAALGRFPLFGRQDLVIPEQARELLPEGVIAYAQADGLGSIAQTFSESALWRRIGAMESYRRYQKSPQYLQLTAGIAFAQVVAGRPLEGALGWLMGRSICIGLIEREGFSEPGLALVVETDDEATAEEVIQALQRLEKLDEKRKMRRATHRGVEVLVLDSKLQVCRIQRYLLASNDPDLVRAMIARACGEGASFAGSALAQAFDTGRPTNAIVSAIVDSSYLTRKSGKDRWLPEKLDNAGGSLLVHDLLEAAARSSQLKVHLAAAGNELTIEMPIDCSPGELPKAFACFAHDQALSSSLPLLKGDEFLLSISEWRDLPAFFRDRRELLIEDAERGFAEFDSGLAVFFGGRVLSEEVIPELCEDYLFVGARQTFEGRNVPPKARFPAGAWIFRMKNADRWNGELVAAFNTLIGVINADRGQKKQTPLLFFSESYRGTTIYGARFLPDDDRPTDLGRYNFSPALARVGDRFILSTADELLRDVVDQLVDGAVETLPPGTLTFLRAQGEPTLQILTDNRDALIAQSMLDKGKSLEQATLELDVLLDIVREVAGIDLWSRISGDRFVVSAAVRLKPLEVVAPAAALPSQEISR